MPTHPRKHSDATQITAEILKEAAQPRQSASVKEALEKKKTPPCGPAHGWWEERWENRSRLAVCRPPSYCVEISLGLSNIAQTPKK